MMKRFYKWIAIGLMLALLIPTLAACASPAGIRAANFMEGITASSTALTREPDDTFDAAYMSFAIELLKGSATLEQEGNLLLSPLSAMLALSMTANGANGATLDEMRALLGDDLTMEELNATLGTWTGSMSARTNTTFSAANSIWTRKGKFTPNVDYLQTLADYYTADVYATPFNDRTVQDINQWVSEKTNQQIDHIIDEIDPNLMLILLNTLYFEAAWSDQYSASQIQGGTFHGTKQDASVSMMRSVESTYLHMDGAQGFKKYFLNGYSFVALLPDEGTPIDEFVSSLSAEQLSTMLANCSDAKVTAQIPSFSYDCTLNLEKVLEQLIPSAFSSAADFSAMGKSNSPLAISQVLQKTTISVDENGTIASAATQVNTMSKGPQIPPSYEIILDRPFVYMIVDESTNLPLFIGVVEQL